MNLEELILNQDKILDKDKMYFLLPANFGDTFIVAQLFDILKEKYNSEIILITRPNQEFILKILGIKDYMLVTFSDEDFKNFYNISDKCPKPRKGSIFVNQHLLHREFNSSGYTLRETYIHINNLSKSVVIPSNFKIPKIKPELLGRLSKIAPIDKIVMFCADANTVKAISNRHWEELAKKLNNDGLTVISSVMDKKNTIKGTIYFEMNAEEALQVAYHCHHVYALRSGFTDLCVNLGNRLTVYYPNHDEYNLYSFNEMYGKTDIIEEIVYQEPEQKEPEQKPNPITKICILGIPIITIKQVIQPIRSKFHIKIFGIQLMKIETSNT